MLECLSEWTAPAIYAAAHTGVVPGRVGHRHALIAPYGLYELGDGTSVMIAVQSNPEWASFATVVLGDDDLVVDPRFVDNEDRITNVDALEARIVDVFAGIDSAEAERRLLSARVAWSRVRDQLAVWEHEQLAARDRKMDVEHPSGTATMLLPPFNISESPDPPPQVPGLGRHDPELVAQLRDRAAAAD